MQNNGQVKRIFNGYIKGDLRPSKSKRQARRSFVPFVEERDHLGQLIDSDIRSDLGHGGYVRKLGFHRARKQTVQVEPRGWLERVGVSSEGPRESDG